LSQTYTICMARKNKPGAGRPTIITPDVVAKLEEAASLGCSVTEMCLFADISRDAYYERARKDKKFADRMEELKERPVLEARSALHKAIKAGDGDLALKYLERKNKKEFSTLHSLEISEQIPYKGLTDEQLAQIAAGKATPGDFIK